MSEEFNQLVNYGVAYLRKNLPVLVIAESTDDHSLSYSEASLEERNAVAFRDSVHTQNPFKHNPNFEASAISTILATAARELGYRKSDAPKVPVQHGWRAIMWAPK